MNWFRRCESWIQENLQTGGHYFWMTIAGLGLGALFSFYRYFSLDTSEIAREYGQRGFAAGIIFLIAIAIAFLIRALVNRSFK